MSELYADIGWKSINHHGEQLCGDHVDVVEADSHTQVVVLADGLGSGVKASILSTLTSKIISTMISQGMSLEDCVSTIAAALPLDAEKHVAYSTFTIIRITDSREAELIQFDNPSVILLRGYNNYEYPKKPLVIRGKTIYRSTINLREGDVFIAMSDGCTNASASRTYSYDWDRAAIADYMKIFAPVGYTAKTLATMLVDECYQKYGEHPLDDATACVVCVRPRQNVSLMIGPPRSRDDEAAMVSAFLNSPGKHIVCGGTTAKVVAGKMGKEIKPLPNTVPTDIPPMSAIEGIDLVTEGVVTINRVNEYALDNLGENKLYTSWCSGRDGACRIARMLLEESTSIHLFVGQAVNPAHADENPEWAISFTLKMTIVDRLASTLRKLGKVVDIQYY